MSKTSGKVRGGGRLGLCFTVMLGFVGNGYAAEYAVAAEKFELKVFERTLGGSEIVVGEYAAAIKIISTSLSLDSKYAKNTNLCVAYTAQRKFSSAQPYCQSALTLSASNRYGDLVAFNSYTARKNYKAMALNNFGVWHALQGNADEAQVYFREAGKRSRELSAASDRNIGALEQRIGSATAAAS